MPLRRNWYHITKALSAGRLRMITDAMCYVITLIRLSHDFILVKDDFILFLSKEASALALSVEQYI
jgi:hypothetical protein